MLLIEYGLGTEYPTLLQEVLEDAQRTRVAVPGIDIRNFCFCIQHTLFLGRAQRVGQRHKVLVTTLEIWFTELKGRG